jgi:hypothetical protein
MDCQNCGRKEADTAMVFKLERWCSDRCRKALAVHTVNEREEK